ncbi:MAG: TonB-dependent receptor, partial [Woeseiaceae bacterium]
GDEGNDVDAVPGYSVVSLHGEHRLNEHVSLFLTIANALNADHETFGLFGEADEVLGDEFDDPRFLGPGAPRAAWVGVSIQ